MREIFLDRKKIDDTRFKDTKNNAIKNRVMRDIRSLFEHEEDYHKPVRVDSFQSNSYIEYESNGDRNKTLSVKDYHSKIRPYVKDIINDLKKSKCFLKVMMRTVRCIQKVITQK